jgi:hypothetical protein
MCPDPDQTAGAGQLIEYAGQVVARAASTSTTVACSDAASAARRARLCGRTRRCRWTGTCSGPGPCLRRRRWRGCPSAGRRSRGGRCRTTAP